MISRWPLPLAAGTRGVKNTAKWHPILKQGSNLPPALLVLLDDTILMDLIWTGSTLGREEEPRLIGITLSCLFRYSSSISWEFKALNLFHKLNHEDIKISLLTFQDLYKVFRPAGLMLTAAIGAAPGTIDAAYDIEKMYQYLDLVHVMCYDYHGKWDKKTGHNAPLRPRPDEAGDDLTLNVDYTLQYLIQLGARPEKTVLGVPFYGRAFSLINPNENKIGDKTKDTSFQVNSTQIWFLCSVVILLPFCNWSDFSFVGTGFPTFGAKIAVVQSPNMGLFDG